MERRSRALEPSLYHITNYSFFSNFALVMYSVLSIIAISVEFLYALSNPSLSDNDFDCDIVCCPFFRTILYISSKWFDSLFFGETYTTSFNIELLSYSYIYIFQKTIGTYIYMMIICILLACMYFCPPYIEMLPIKTYTWTAVISHHILQVILT